MKTYLYNEQGVDRPIEITETEIINLYWSSWMPRMVKKYGEGSELITLNNCIEDWVVCNWAWEKNGTS